MISTLIEIFEIFEKKFTKSDGNYWGIAVKEELFSDFLNKVNFSVEN